MATVMIVDDSMFMRHMLRGILTANGHQVVAEAQNGAQSIEMYGTHRPDIVTMDITMPVMSGLDALRELMHHFPDATVIMVSAMGQQSLVMESIRLGAKGFIVKPIQKGTVLQEVERCIANANTRRT